MALDDYFKGFKDGLKINNDLDNWQEGPHWDIIADLRNDIGGIDKMRIDNKGNVISGETQIGKLKLPW
ncbi:MAG: hypothetical protein V1709_12015 [Planctomycetota bacterium]